MKVRQANDIVTNGDNETRYQVVKLSDGIAGQDGQLISVTNPLPVTQTTSGLSAKVTDHLALQVTPPPEGKGSFGEALVANLEHEIIVNFTYGIIPSQVIIKANQSGSASHTNSMAVASTGAASNSSCILQTLDRIRYKPGHGSRARFTALFTTGVVDSEQGVGIGDESNGFYFGYDGTSFGVLHRKDGSEEIRTLTVSVGSSTAENITITLNGDAKSDIAVTNTGDVTLTVNEIAAADYSDVGSGWTAHAVGDKVRFISWDAAVKTGTYTLSSATSAVGSFAQDIVGVVPSDNWIPQSLWNGDDKLDGSGITGVTIDPTKGNVYQISYQWLGYGLISFFIEDPDDGEFHLVHAIRYANANTTPSLSNPTLPMCIFTRNTANTTDISVSSSSMGGFTDGTPQPIGPRAGYNASITLGASAVEKPMITLRCKDIFLSKVNTAILKILLIQGSVDHTKPVEISFYSNTILTGASFLSAGENSITETDVAATDFTGGTFLFSVALGKNGNAFMDFSKDKLATILIPGDSLTATIKPKSGNAAEATVVFNTLELY